MDGANRLVLICAAEMKLDLDHYLVLGVPRTADAAEVRAAYIGLVKRYHPDVAAGDPELALANFRLISEAYATLADPERRAAYDARARLVEVALATNARPGLAGGRRLGFEGKPPARMSVLGVSIVAAVFLGVGGFLAGRALYGSARGLPPADNIAAAARSGEPSASAASQLPPESPASQPSLSRHAAIGPVGVRQQPGLPRAPRLDMPTGQANCVTEEGTRFTIVNRGGNPSVAYNGDPAVMASVQFAGQHMLLLNNIVPDDAVIIGVLRRDKVGALVFHFDRSGKPLRVVAARCEGLAY